MTERVFLDYAATAPLLPQVRELLESNSVYKLGNPSTLYSEGRQARQALEQARSSLAGVVSCAAHDLYFCSGGTEAAGTLVEGIARGALEKSGKKTARMHIVCAAFEHPAVLQSVLSLKRLGYEISLLRSGKDGRIAPERLEAALRADTLMVVIMLAQNELGTVQDIACLTRLAHGVGAFFVCDCVQGLTKLPIVLTNLAVDAAFFSSHKIGGPFGIGAFYLRPSVPFLPRQLGGGQEQKLRSGTQNVPGALGFALAAELETARMQRGEQNRQGFLRDNLLKQLTQESSRIRATVSIARTNTSTHLPGHLHVLVQDIESQTMILKLDEMGFAVSGGAACSSNTLEPSHVLTSMGVSRDDAYGALRVSLGGSTSPDDCDRFATALLSLLEVSH
ncbi:MAG: cysteine desulfurase [Coriobacteriia bacterium]|nr:cysteine desulfurase [Coriobacteriia bacterium]